MNNKDALKKIIMNDGRCKGIHCDNCPLCIYGDDGNGHCGYPSDEESYNKAKDILKKIEIDEAVDKMLKI